MLLSGAAEGLPGQERERIGGASGAGHVLNSYPGRRIAESSCLQGPLGCFLICLTLEGTEKVKAAEFGPSYPELVTSSVSCSPRMKVALSLVAV